MTSESQNEMDQPSQSTSENNVVALKPEPTPELPKSVEQVKFEEMSAAIPQELRDKINHTLAFLEAGMNQWEQVKEKGHSPKSFVESFIQVMGEYDGLRESGTDRRRAQMLTLMKIRGQIVALAYADLKKKEQ